MRQKEQPDEHDRSSSQRHGPVAGDATGTYERGTRHSGGNRADCLVCPARKVARLTTPVLGFAPGEAGGHLFGGLSPVTVWVLLADYAGGLLYLRSRARPDGKCTVSTVGPDCVCVGSAAH